MSVVLETDRKLGSVKISDNDGIIALGMINNELVDTVSVIPTRDDLGPYSEGHKGKTEGQRLSYVRRLGKLFKRLHQDLEELAKEYLDVHSGIHPQTVVNNLDTILSVLKNGHNLGYLNFSQETDITGGHWKNPQVKNETVTNYLKIIQLLEKLKNTIMVQSWMAEAITRANRKKENSKGRLRRQAEKLVKYLKKIDPKKAIGYGLIGGPAYLPAAMGMIDIEKAVKDQIDLNRESDQYNAQSVSEVKISALESQLINMTQSLVKDAMGVINNQRRMLSGSLDNYVRFSMIESLRNNRVINESELLVDVEPELDTWIRRILDDEKRDSSLSMSHEKTGDIWVDPQEDVRSRQARQDWYVPRDKNYNDLLATAPSPEDIIANPRIDEDGYPVPSGNLQSPAEQEIAPNQTEVYPLGTIARVLSSTSLYSSPNGEIIQGQELLSDQMVVALRSEAENGVVWVEVDTEDYGKAWVRSDILDFMRTPEDLSATDAVSIAVVNTNRSNGVPEGSWLTRATTSLDGNGLPLNTNVATLVPSGDNNREIPAYAQQEDVFYIPGTNDDAGKLRTQRGDEFPLFFHHDYGLYAIINEQSIPLKKVGEIISADFGNGWTFSSNDTDLLFLFENVPISDQWQRFYSEVDPFNSLPLNVPRGWESAEYSDGIFYNTDNRVLIPRLTLGASGFILDFKELIYDGGVYQDYASNVYYRDRDKNNWFSGGQDLELSDIQRYYTSLSEKLGTNYIMTVLGLNAYIDSLSNLTYVIDENGNQIRVDSRGDTLIDPNNSQEVYIKLNTGEWVRENSPLALTTVGEYTNSLSFSRDEVGAVMDSISIDASVFETFMFAFTEGVLGTNAEKNILLDVEDGLGYDIVNRVFLKVSLDPNGVPVAVVDAEHSPDGVGKYSYVWDENRKDFVVEVVEPESATSPYIINPTMVNGQVTFPDGYPGELWTGEQGVPKPNEPTVNTFNPGISSEIFELGPNGNKFSIRFDLVTGRFKSIIGSRIVTVQIDNPNTQGVDLIHDVNVYDVAVILPSGGEVIVSIPEYVYLNTFTSTSGQPTENILSILNKLKEGDLFRVNIKTPVDDKNNLSRLNRFIYSKLSSGNPGVNALFAFNFINMEEQIMLATQLAVTSPTQANGSFIGYSTDIAVEDWVLSR